MTPKFIELPKDIEPLILQGDVIDSIKKIPDNFMDSKVKNGKNKN